MEIIRAIISIFIGLLFLSFIIKITWPILVLFAVFILYLVLRTAIINRQYRNRSQNNQNQYRDSGQRQSHTNQRSSNQDPNIIDVEYTEEELD